MVRIETVSEVVDLYLNKIVTMDEARNLLHFDVRQNKVAAAREVLQEALDSASERGTFIWRAGIVRALEILA